MTLDWMQLALGAGGLLLLQGVKDGFPLLNWFKGRFPATAPAVNAAEAAATVAAPAIKSRLQPLLDILDGAMSHINDLQTLQAYLTALHLTPLPTTVTTPMPTTVAPTAVPSPDALTEILTLLKNLQPKAGA